MTKPPMLEYDFDNPIPWDEFMRKFEERVKLANKLEQQPTVHAAPTNEQRHQWSIMGYFMGGES